MELNKSDVIAAMTKAVELKAEAFEARANELTNDFRVASEVGDEIAMSNLRMSIGSLRTSAYSIRNSLKIIQGALHEHPNERISFAGSEEAARAEQLHSV